MEEEINDRRKEERKNRIKRREGQGERKRKKIKNCTDKRRYFSTLFLASRREEGVEEGGTEGRREEREEKEERSRSEIGI